MGSHGCLLVLGAWGSTRITAQSCKQGTRHLPCLCLEELNCLSLVIFKSIAFWKAVLKNKILCEGPE